RALRLCFLLLSTAAPCSSSFSLSLHDALPILLDYSSHIVDAASHLPHHGAVLTREPDDSHDDEKPPQDGSRPKLQNSNGDGDIKDRKSTRLNSSHVSISYAVFCLKKKKTTTK